MEAEFERLEKRANRTPQGADHKAILAKVASIVPPAFWEMEGPNVG